MITCRRAAELLALARDRRLGWFEWAGLRLHLAVCAMCRRFQRQLDVLEQAHVHQAEAPAPLDADTIPVLSAEARQRIKEALRAPPTPERLESE